MALGNINIDDRDYEQLLGILKQHIPTGEWRDHNPSDPGIMLLELLAWLGEMSLYRMNRVPASHRDKFVKLIADPPQPATALLTFTAMLDPAVRPLDEPLRVPVGTRLATPFANGRRYVFETLKEVELLLPETTLITDPPVEVSGQVAGRELVIVDRQPIATSDGTADQVFPLEPPREVVETPDHPPEMSVPVDFTPALARSGVLGEGSGISRIGFPAVDLEEAHLLSFDPAGPALTLTRLGGATETVPLLPTPIVASTTESVLFPALGGLEVVLDEHFDKGDPIAIEDALVTVDGGAGVIDPLSVVIVAARGIPLPQGSTLLTFSRLDTPQTAVLASSGGLRGVVDLTTSGVRTVYLDDPWGRGIELQLDVTTPFDGGEAAAAIDLLALGNLFFLGTLETVRHSPWSEVLMDFVHRSAEYDPNPQILVSDGFTPALAADSKVVPEAGVAAVSYPSDSTEESFLLTYLLGPERLRLERLGGPSQTVAVSSSQVDPGATELVDFTTFNVEVYLDHRFDKGVAIDVDPVTVVVDFGTTPPLGAGVIDPGSVQIVATSGLVAPLASLTLTLSNLSDPQRVVVTAEHGLRGRVDLSTAGTKVVRLTDVWQRRLDVELAVTTPFNGNEVAASIDLHALENLLFLGTLWEARTSLRTEASQVVSGSGSPVRHCHVDPFDRTLRFGNGAFGSIPPDNAEIVASYRVLQGPEALVGQNRLEFLLDPPPIFPTESFAFANEDAEGGMRFFSPSTRTAEALLDLNRTYRLVTADDFERVLRVDFNELDVMAQSAPNVLSPDEIRAQAAAEPTIRRAVAMMNRDQTLAERRGHVAILVLARLGSAIDPAILRDESVPLATKQLAVDLEPRLEDRVLRFLDERRLITTRLSLTSALLKAVTVNTFVIVERSRNVVEMTETLRTALFDFFDIYSGYFAGDGWPLGRAVYRSELYQLLEGVDGVDHVASLALSPADPNQDVALAPGELPILQTLTLSVDRA